MNSINKKISLSITIIFLVLIVLFFIKVIKSECNINKELDRVRETTVVEYNNAYYEEILPQDLKKYNLTKNIKANINNPLDDCQNLITNKPYGFYSTKEISNLSVLICKNNKNNHYFYCVFCNYMIEKDIKEILKIYGIEKADDIKKIKTGKFTHKDKKYIKEFYNKLLNSETIRNVDSPQYLYEIKIYNDTNIPISMLKYRKNNKEYLYVSFSYYLLN